eukprot:jgi/Mesen1/2909/ME000175S02065
MSPTRCEENDCIVQKKKKSKDDAGSQSAAHAEENMLPAEVADARYAAAIEGLRSNDEMCMWVQLGKCRVGDKKARKLFEAMKGNKTVTSIDLSENTISDDGLQALATVLAGGAAPDLISLNLKSNPITEKGRAVLSGLQRVRKLVKVDYEDPDAAVDASKMTAEFNESMPKNRWLSGAVNGWDSQDETVRNGMRERGEKDLSPQQKVDAALKAIKDASTSLIPGLLAARIMSVVFMVERELKDESPKAIHKASIDALPKRRSAEQAAGRHRVATVELLQRLALACCPSIDEVLLSSGAVVRVRDLMFDTSATLFEGEEGLLARLSRAGSEGAILAVDKRPGYLGHVIRISALLKDSAAKHPSLKERLARSKAWQVYASDLGPLDTLLAEQAGDLGGPKPLSLPFFLNAGHQVLFCHGHLATVPGRLHASLGAAQQAAARRQQEGALTDVKPWRIVISGGDY